MHKQVYDSVVWAGLFSTMIGVRFAVVLKRHSGGFFVQA